VWGYFKEEALKAIKKPLRHTLKRTSIKGRPFWTAKDIEVNESGKRVERESRVRLAR
jgi:hypothetical protein